jgi:hypothetical protein
MLTVDKCRKLAKACQLRASDAGAPRTASLLQNIARSFSGLASQLEALSGDGQSIPKVPHEKRVMDKAALNRFASRPKPVRPA